VEDVVARGYRRIYTYDEGYASIPKEYLYEGTPIPFTIEIPSDAPTQFEGMYSKLFWRIVANIDIALAFDVQAETIINIFNGVR